VTEKEEFLGKVEISGGGVRNSMTQASDVFPDATGGIASGKQ